MEEVQLGYPSVQKFDERDPLTSKLGGNPAWMEGPPSFLPQCRICGRIIPLVCQLHVPLEGRFYRVLYVFVCQEYECSCLAGGWTVLRVQREDKPEDKVVEPFRTDYSAFESDETEDSGWGADEGIELDDLEDLLRLRNVKISADKESEKPTAEERTKEQHQSDTEAPSIPAELRRKQVFIEWGSEPQELKLTKKEEKKLSELLRRYEQQEIDAADTADASTAWIGEVYEKDNLSTETRYFQRLMKRIERSPSQCIRYAFEIPLRSEKDSQPITVKSTNKIS